MYQKNNILVKSFLKMKIKVIPIFRDNYSYLLQCTRTNVYGVIDPAEPQKVIESLGNIIPQFLLTTHHHNDHSGGNTQITKIFPRIQVYGSDQRIPCVTKIVEDRKTFQVGELDVTPFFTPGHTIGSISYYVHDLITDEKAVFTGDTLFVGGCGRFFEGTPTDMYHSLIEILGNLPGDTKVYCGHEYTASNLTFAQSIEPQNEQLEKKLRWSKSVHCTVPSSIEDERNYNPFMRVHLPEIQRKLNVTDPIKCMGILRELKNKF
jgi:hydroxyacylglutathione hydrolase